MKQIPPLAATLLLTAWVPMTHVSAGEAGRQPYWPELHGRGRTNISPERDLLKRWPEGGPPLAWTYSPCGKGYSSVTIAEEKIFTAGDFGNREMLLALDLDGKLLWKAPNGAAWRGSSPGSRATPTYNEGMLYHMNPSGRLAAYEADSGQPVWHLDLKSRFDAKHGIWAFSENVVVDGNKVLCMPGGAEARVAALDKRTGETLWTNTQIEHSAAYCSPVVVTYRDVRQVISMTQRSVVGVDVDTGELIWSAPFVPKFPQNALMPVFHDGFVFVACGHSSGGTLMKIEPDSRAASTVWHRRDLDNCHGGSVLMNGRLFGCGCRSGGKSFYCVDFFTGKTIKTDRTLGKVAITCADDMIYCLHHRGEVSLLAITPEGFDIVSQFRLERKPPNSYLAHPVVCGGKLYLRCDDDLYAYDIRLK